jgi:hypothetical protein
MGSKEWEPFVLYLMMETIPSSEMMCFEESQDNGQCPEEWP